ncbi:pyruvate dehydrogenase complex E1 component subunit beta [Bradymonas sediminis]|uniref:Pyruvate dehydrogenase complex E1 component subunit beta n=1 Tax=Bradymonas sediminis TaxID=1548548 RepID=A0A2Z4FNZ3_9DELT|nr:pyruvate dehydrogenase complex E1 component subunit beta [Bradymonas sediminis]AWV90466.1 pyruvate dehydrogenase complex E1 component subunit beta [Bradymonas sediminis]TDP72148.1 pyruvate dehydrogenase E1 component beta subunit [Bradymonas sediminis]
MRKILFREALREAMVEEMERDDSVFLMGEEVAEYNGAYKVSQGMLDQFGAKRVIDTPIAELGFAGLGIGAAMVGLKPIVEMMTFNFAILALDQVVNTAAKMRYMSGGALSCPIVIRGAGGAGGALGAQHSQSLEAQYAHIPGLKVMMPATPYDAKGMLKTAIRDPDPVIFIEGEILYGTEGEVPEEEYLIPMGKGDIKRGGKDVTLIAWSRMVHLCLDAAEELAKEGIDAEVIDLRTIRPFDREMIAESVKKTNRAVIVEEGWPMASVGGAVSDWIARELFDYLDAPVGRIHQRDVPMPYAYNLEAATLPKVEDVIAAVKKATYTKS